MAGRSPVLILVALALITALVANVALGVKLRHQRDTTASLEQEIRLLNQQLDLLRGRISGSGSSDPLGRIASATAMLRGLNFIRTVKPELLSPAELSVRVCQMIAH